MAAVRVRIWPTVQDVHDGVSRYTAELCRALEAREEVALVGEGEDYDVLHLVAAHVYPAEWREAKAAGKRLVVTVHDLIPEHEGLVGPQYDGVAERKAVLDAADAIVAVSQWTKDDVIRTYGIHPDKITVIHNGVNQPVGARVPRARTCTAVARDARPYLLWVGRRAGYKNFFWFVRAVAPFLWTHPGMRVVCTGGQAFGRRERLLLTLLGLARRFEVRGVDEAALQALYAGAYAMVMPSRAEGFGLPVVEAMAAGCPVVLPRAHVFPEIAGEAALWCELGNASEMRVCLIRLADPDLRSALIRKGRAQSRRFAWPQAATAVSALYRLLSREASTAVMRDARLEFTHFFF